VEFLDFFLVKYLNLETIELSVIEKDSESKRFRCILIIY